MPREKDYTLLIVAIIGICILAWPFLLIWALNDPL